MNMRAEAAASSGFLLSQLLASKRYSAIEKDALRAVLQEHVRYTHEEARTLLQQHYKLEVR